MRRRIHGRHGDRGVVLLVFALSLTTISVLAAYVLGSSTGYSARRNAQNAADSAAVAATARLRQVYLGETSASEVAATAIAVAEDNGATPGTIECDIVTAQYALTKADADVIGPCDGTNENDLESAGVRVRAGDTRDVPFGAFVSDDQITGRAVAAATIQPVRGGRSPFMVCAALSAVGHPAPPLVADPASPVGYSVNPAAIGEDYVLWGNAVKEDGRDCGNGSSSWRGLVDFEQTFQTPTPSSDPAQDEDWWRVETGNKTGGVPRTLAGPDSCDITVSNGDVSTTVGCRVAIPGCLFGNGETGSNFRLHCVSMITFEVSFADKGPGPCHGGDQKMICGTLVGGGVATGGPTGAATPAAEDVVVIDLVQ